MGFIGYIAESGAGETGGDELIRVFLECRDEASEVSDEPGHPSDGAPTVSYTYAVEVLFPPGMVACRINGVDDVLVLKKFYKLVHSLEERAREHGNPRQKARDTAAGFLRHLGYTRNARDLSGVRLMPRKDVPIPGNGMRTNE